MTNINRLNYEMNNKDYFDDAEKTLEIYNEILVENGLDPLDTFSKENDQIAMLESVYTILQMLSNNIELYIKVQTEFATTSAAYQYLQKRLEDIRKEIDRIKLDTHYEDAEGNTSSLVSFMYYNARSVE